jgi:hypothetical protein
MFKMLHNNQYPTILDNISPRVPAHDYATRQLNNFVLPFPVVESVRINYQYQFLNVWNSIPFEIRSSDTIHIFNRAYRSYLLCLYSS